MSWLKINLCSHSGTGLPWHLQDECLEAAPTWDPRNSNDKGVCGRPSPLLPPRVPGQHKINLKLPGKAQAQVRGSVRVLGRFPKAWGSAWQCSFCSTMGNLPADFSADAGALPDHWSRPSPALHQPLYQALRALVMIFLAIVCLLPLSVGLSPE